MWFSFFITWEQRKLGDLGKAQSGIGFPDKEQGGKTGIPFFKVSDMNNVGNELEMNRSNNYVSPDQIKKNGWSPIEETSVIFAKVGAAIMLNRKRLVRFPFLLDNNTMAYKFSDSWDIEFGRTLFERIDLTSLVQVGALPSYNAGDVENMEAAIPQMAEQYKLGALFKSLDNLITLHQRKQNWQNSRFLRKISSLILAIAWEQRKLGELCEKFADGDWIEAKDQSSSGIRLIQTGNIGLGEYLDKPNNKKWISEDTFNRLHCEEVCTGDILISRLPEPAGRACIVPNLGTKMITAVDCTIVRTSAKVSKKFLLQHLSSKKYFDEVNTCMAGGTRQRISRSNLANFNVLIPISFDEQESIGRVLCGLDNLITLHQCEEILIHNEYGSSSLFRSQYKMANAWEQRKFKDMVQIERGGSPRPIDDYITDEPDGLNWVKIGDAPQLGNYITKTAEKIKPSGLSKTREVHPGDLILSNSMSFGKPYIMGINGCIHDGWLLIRDAQGLFELRFLCHLLGTRQMLAQYKALASGSTVNNLNKELVGNTIVAVPNKDEQQQIGFFLESIDNLITLHQCKRAAFVSRKSPSIFQFEKWRNTLTWEQRKVGELLEERDVKAPKSLEYPLMAFIANEGVAPKGDRYDRSALVNDTENKPYKQTELGDFIYSSNNLETGSIGLNKYGKASISPVYSIFYPTELADSDFLGRRLVRKDFINEMVKWRQGVIYGQWRIHESDFIKIEVAVPCVEEQRKIGRLLDSIDNLITLHQRGENIYNRRQTW